MFRPVRGVVTVEYGRRKREKFQVLTLVLQKFQLFWGAAFCRLVNS